MKQKRTAISHHLSIHCNTVINRDYQHHLVLFSSLLSWGGGLTERTSQKFEYGEGCKNFFKIEMDPQNLGSHENGV